MNELWLLFLIGLFGGPRGLLQRSSLRTSFSLVDHVVKVSEIAEYTLLLMRRLEGEHREGEHYCCHLSARADDGDWYDRNDRAGHPTAFLEVGGDTICPHKRTLTRNQ